MCGIAGLIHKGKTVNIGKELQDMLQALKHRGPDSTGYALYGEGSNGDYIMRFKVGENVGEGSSAINEDKSVYDSRKKQVDSHLKEDKVIQSAMPDEMYKVFHWYKNDEWEKFLGATTQWDLDTYLDCLP